MSKLKSYLLIGIFVAGASFAGISQDKKNAGVEDAKIEKTRGEDPNIKIAKGINKENAESKAVQPVEKGGTPTRSGISAAVFDNYTDWYIDCYVDGCFKGQVSPWGDGTVFVPDGATTLYVVARFDTGKKITWGPITKNCFTNVFTIEIHEEFYRWNLE